MAQLLLRFDDEGDRKADPLFIRNDEKSVAPSPAEVAILRQILLEDELARATSPEARQRINARFAAEERRAAIESRRSG